MGTGASEEGNNDRVLAKRLLTIEWQQRELPEVERADAGTWLLISTTANDLVADSLTDALKSNGAQCVAMYWPRPPTIRRTRNSSEVICARVDSSAW